MHTVVSLLPLFQDVLDAHPSTAIVCRESNQLYIVQSHAGLKLSCVGSYSQLSC